MLNIRADTGLLVAAHHHPTEPAMISKSIRFWRMAMSHLYGTGHRSAKKKVCGNRFLLESGPQVHPFQKKKRHTWEIQRQGAVSTGRGTWSEKTMAGCVRSLVHALCPIQLQGRRARRERNGMDKEAERNPVQNGLGQEKHKISLLVGQNATQRNPVILRHPLTAMLLFR